MAAQEHKHEPTRRSGRLASLLGVAALVAGALLGSGLDAHAAQPPPAKVARPTIPGAVPGVSGFVSLHELQQVPAAPARPASVALSPMATGRAVVQGGPFTVPAWSYISAWIYCPGGMVATSGGEYNSDASGQVVMTGSQAIDGGSGWQSTVFNQNPQGGASATFTIYAVCFSGLSNYQITFGKSQIPGYGVQTIDAPACPPGTVLVGGGGSGDQAAMIFRVFRNSTYAGGGGWSFGIRNDYYQPGAMYVQGICASGLNNQQTVTLLNPATSPGEFRLVNYNCPAGSAATSGGTQSQVGQYYNQYNIISDSFPSGTGWSVYVKNPGDIYLSLWAYVTCVSVS